MHTFRKNCIPFLALAILAAMFMGRPARLQAASVGKVKTLTLTQRSGTQIKLKWSSVSKATGYMVYRYDKSSGRYKAFRQIKGSGKTSCIDGATNANLQQKYAVKAYKTSGKKTVTGSAAKATWKGAQQNTYIAHRGAMHCAPQNTMAAFEKAKELGYKAFECDVWYTNSGDLLIFHHTTSDASIKDCSGVDLKIYDITRTTRKMYPIHTKYSENYPTQYFPTLDEVLSFCQKNKMEVYLHFWPMSSAHDTRALAQTSKLIRKYGMLNKARVFTQHPTDIKTFLRYGLITGYLSRQTSTTGMKRDELTAANMGCKFIIFPFTTSAKASKNMTNLCHTDGMKIYYHNVKTPTIVKLLMNRGVDGWVSNQPVFVK